MAIDFSGINNSGKAQNNTDRRVESLNRENAAPRSPTASSQAASTTGSDKISLTDTAARLKALEAQLAKLPVVDSKRVDGVQRALTSGNYSVNAERVAGKLIQFEQQLASKG